MGGEPGEAGGPAGAGAGGRGYTAMPYTMVKSVPSEPMMKTPVRPAMMRPLPCSALKVSRRAVAPMRCLAAPQIAMLEAVRRGDLATGGALRDRLDPLCQAIYAAPLRNYRVRMKEALVFQGILKNAVVRAPLPAASDEERAAVRRALIHAGLL